jgi:hypothetical protein
MSLDRHLDEQVAQCDVLLVIIGENWLVAKDDEGKRRLDNEGDFVRIEIASALKSGKRVIPVLVNEADMPRPEDLPELLKPLARRNAVAIRPTRFKADSQGLINALKDALAVTEAERAAKTEAQRQAAEEERKRRVAEEETRAKRIEEEARSRAQAGLTSEEIRTAAELANWDFIKGSSSPDEFRDHLARFVGGTTERYARKRLEELLWALPDTHAAIQSLRTFVDEFPKGEYASQAQGELAELEKAAEAGRLAEARKRAETDAWAKAAASTEIDNFEAFLKEWPLGAHAPDAKARIKELRSGRISRRGVLKGAGIGVAVTAAGGGILYSAGEPGSWIWRQIYDWSMRTLTGHADSVFTVAFSPDGRTLASGSSKPIKLWDVASGRELRTITGHANNNILTNVWTVAFSPDGRTLASCSSNNTIKLWEVASGRELRTLAGHTSSVYSVAFSPDGRTLASGSSDNTIKLWDVSRYLAAR